MRPVRLLSFSVFSSSFGTESTHVQAVLFEGSQKIHMLLRDEAETGDTNGAQIWIQQAW